MISLSATLIIWLAISIGVIWGIGSWYKSQQGDQPTVWGASWSTKQAEKLGLNPTDDLDELLAHIPFKKLQLMSYWDEIEAEKDNYDFTSLSRQFEIAKSRNVGVSLQLGLHQSRQPKCHQPNWANGLDQAEFKNQLKKYIGKIIERFDEEVNLIQYQLEPEIFEADSELCPQSLNKEDLKELYAHVKDLTAKEISVSRPNNLAIWRKRDPNPDSFGLKLEPYPKSANWFKRTYRRAIPAHYYSFSAGNLKIFHSNSHLFIRDLKAEPDDLEKILDGPQTDGQNPDLKTETLRDRLDYAGATGVKTIYLNGAEWWLWQKNNGQTDIWQTVSEVVQTDF